MTLEHVATSMIDCKAVEERERDQSQVQQQQQQQQR
jgi:hypothetical protein